MSEILIYLATNILHLGVVFVCFLLVPLIIVFIGLLWVEHGRTRIGAVLCTVYAIVGFIMAGAYLSYFSPFGYPDGVDQHTSWNGYHWQNALYSYDEYRAAKKRKEPPTVIVIDTSVRRYKIIDWKPPVYARVSLKDTQTGEEFKDYAVGKYCNAAPPKLGSEINLDVREYRMSNDPPHTVRTGFLDLRTPFCSDS